MRMSWLVSTDVARCARSHPALLPSLGANAPRWLESLVAGGFLRGSVFEGPLADAPLAFGFTGFVRGAALPALFEPPRPSMLGLLVRAAQAGRNPLLNDAGIARAMAVDDLHILVPLYWQGPRSSDDPRSHDLMRLGFEAFRLLHDGYAPRSIWHEGDAPDEAVMASGGYRVHARLGATLLYRATRAELTTPWPASPVSQLFLQRPVRLGLTAAQRRIAHLSLWRWSDEQIAEHLGLSIETVRRHWRDMFVRAAPQLRQLQTADDARGAEAGRGPEKRRHLQDYLRWNLHEVRPGAATA